MHFLDVKEKLIGKTKSHLGVVRIWMSELKMVELEITFERRKWKRLFKRLYYERFRRAYRHSSIPKHFSENQLILSFWKTFPHSNWVNITLTALLKQKRISLKSRLNFFCFNLKNNFFLKITIFLHEKIF